MRDGLLDGADIDLDAVSRECAGFPFEDIRSPVAGQSAVGGHPLHVSELYGRKMTIVVAATLNPNKQTNNK